MMKKVVLCAVGLILVVGIIYELPLYAEDIPSEVINAYQKVIKIEITSFEKNGWRSSYGQGSGFFVEPNKILTAAHVGGSPEELLGLWFSIRSVEVEGKDYPVVNVVGIDFSKELALLEISQNFPSYVLSFSDKVEKGDRVYFVGFSEGKKRLFSGTVDEVDEDGFSVIPQRGKEKLSLLGKVLPGMSGGPILNQDGEVVGVIWGGHPLGFAGATPLEEIKIFLEEKDDK